MNSMTSSVRYAAWDTSRRLLWLGFIVTFFLGLLAFPPPSFWFEVERVHVHDAVEGSTPLMEVDREIKRPFRGHWVATVMRKGKTGFYTFCMARGENDYSPDSHLPDVVDLNWWTWPTRCILPAGTYQLRTYWSIQPPLLPAKELRITSNVFQITR